MVQAVMCCSLVTMTLQRGGPLFGTPWVCVTIVPQEAECICVPFADMEPVEHFFHITCDCDGMLAEPTDHSSEWTTESFAIMVESFSLTGCITALRFHHASLSINIWLLWVSSKAYIRFSESGELGDSIHTEMIIDVLPPSSPVTQHDNEEVSCAEDLSAEQISGRGVKIIIRRVVQEPRTTCGNLHKNLVLAGTILSKKISYLTWPVRTLTMQDYIADENACCTSFNVFWPTFWQACEILGKFSLAKRDQN